MCGCTWGVMGLKCSKQGTLCTRSHLQIMSMGMFSSFLKCSLEPHLTLRQRLSPIQEKDALEQFSKR